jgi:hypothetical protein
MKMPSSRNPPRTPWAMILHLGKTRRLKLNLINTLQWQSYINTPSPMRRKDGIGDSKILFNCTIVYSTEYTYNATYKIGIKNLC